MTYIGIDPGKKGALAIIHPDGVTSVFPFSEETYKKKLSLLRYEECFCILERVSAMPGQGVTSMFNFGKNFGYIQGLLEANNVPYELITPQKWKRSFGVTADKNSSVSVCRRLFPGQSLKRTERCRTDDDGIAEALLMAEYGRRVYGKDK